jgi:uncharacterized protein (TIGR03089 family)
MRIGGVGARPAPSSDIPAALSGAVSSLGQRPSITSFAVDGRQEQGFASLAGWVAKGANLLRDEYGLGAGDRLGIAAPPGWPLASVTLAAWWLGIVVVPASHPDLLLRVLHVGMPVPDADGSVLWLGDALDGSGTPPVAGDECWTDAVIPYPDRAPAPHADGSALALDLGDDGGAATQLELLHRYVEDPGGVLGIVRYGDEDLLQRPDGSERLTALTLRPLITGTACVVAEETSDRDGIAAAERVVDWLA